MKKKILVLVVLILAIGVTWFGLEVYKYYNPESGFKIGVPLDKNYDIYIENLTYYINERSIFGANKEIYDKSFKILDGAYKLRNQILEKYSAPIHVNITVSEEKGKTEVIFEGVGINKLSGKDEDIREKVAFDFVVK